MKNRLVFLNTSIITSYGLFRFKKISLSEAIKTVDSFQGHNWEVMSAVGHNETAKMMGELLGVIVEMNRITYEQKSGDTCLVFKLNSRPPEGKILSREEMEKIGYSFGLLTLEQEREEN